MEVILATLETLLTADFALRAYAIAGIVLTFVLAYDLARRDVRWIRELDLSEYAKKQFPWLENVNKPETAQRYLDSLADHEQERWDAALARASRLVLVGVVVPAVVTLLVVANHSWFFPNEAPLVDVATGAAINPSINQALIFVATQELSFLSELLSLLRFPPFPYEHNPQNVMLGALVYALKLLVSGYIIAVVAFVWRLKDFGSANLETKARLRQIIANAERPANAVVGDRSDGLLKKAA